MPLNEYLICGNGILDFDNWLLKENEMNYATQDTTPSLNITKLFPLVSEAAAKIS
jgi:hypothetical protein